ncbi:MAG TPA: TIGR03435 family protein [Acidobacteriaceae bacterium]
MAQSASVKPLTMAKDADPDFDVVTIKPSDPDDKFDVMTTRGRHIVIRNKSLEAMLRLAYGVQRSQIIGAPDWTRTDRFDIDGVPNVDGQPNMKQFQVLVQKVLAERFGLKSHHEQREMPVFALAVAKDGPKMVPSKGDPNGLPDNEGMGGNGRQIRKYTNVSMNDLAMMLQFNLDRPVVDQTGVKGRYDFRMQWTVDEGQAPADPDAPPGLFTAIQEQIGLKLESTKAPVDVLVIDHVEKPSPN